MFAANGDCRAGVDVFAVTVLRQSNMGVLGVIPKQCLKHATEGLCGQGMSSLVPRGMRPFLSCGGRARDVRVLHWMGLKGGRGRDRARVGAGIWPGVIPGCLPV